MQNNRFASASSVDTSGNASATARRAATQLQEELGGPPDWVLVFFSATLNPEHVTAGLAQSLPKDTPLIGCSSYAEINRLTALTHSVSLLGSRRSTLRAKTVALPSDNHTAFEMGQLAGRELAPFHPDLLILVPDVLTINATQALRGVQSILGRHFPIIGGAAADNGDFARTFLLHNGTLQGSGLVGLALKGPLRLETAARSGYIPLSTPRTVTAMENENILLELDGRPALDVYREFLGPRADEMPHVSVEFPIGTIPPGMKEAPALTRAVFKIDEQRRALILGGDIPTGEQLRILGASRKDVLAGAREAAEQAHQALPDADFALFFSCMSRKLALGPHYEEECKSALSLLPPEMPKLGFYTFGELSPRHGISEHHESTFTVALIKAEGEPAGG